MPPRQGFPQAQFDSSFPADPKHQRLALKLAQHGGDDGDLWALAGIGLWALGIAHAWANDDADVSEVVADRREALVDALMATGLLTEDGHVPPEAFAKWTERARQSRDQGRQRAAASRERARTSAYVRRSTPVDVEVEKEEQETNTSSILVRGHRARPRASAGGPSKTGMSRPFEVPA